MKHIFRLVIACALSTLSFTSPAQDSLVETVVNGCEKELLGYCGEVTPGEGRVLACLYAHEDKLSSQCGYALYDAAILLDRFISSLAYLVNECAEDMDTHCAAVEAGEGRIAQCLLDNKASVQPRCSTAIDVTELSVE